MRNETSCTILDNIASNIWLNSLTMLSPRHWLCLSCSTSGLCHRIDRICVGGLFPSRRRRDVFHGEYFRMNDMLAANHDVKLAACIDLKLLIDWRPVEREKAPAGSIFPFSAVCLPGFCRRNDVGVFQGSHKPNFFLSESV